MSRRTASRSGNVVDMEVANLMKLENKSPAQLNQAILALRSRYNDEDLVNKIQDVLIQRHSSILKSAKKFAEAVRTKYQLSNIPFHQLLMKARLHAKKHGLTEAEFSEFQRIYEQELSGNGSNEVFSGTTNLMKVLGNATTGVDNYFNVDDADARNLQEILKLYEASKQLHSQVILQAIQWEGHDTQTLNAVFDNTRMNPADHVHPVVVALFTPKIKTIEHHFLYSNIAGIVKSRYNRTPLTTRPDYELFYNLVTDPNDVVCDTRTPVGDLLHRCNLQNQLWNSVLHLRNGQLFNPSLREFLTSVDVCRLNRYDNPDLVYGRHDGTIIKRLFSAFSYRPTVVATIPQVQLFHMNNPYAIRPLVTSIPMINVRPLQRSLDDIRAAEGRAGKPETELSKSIDLNTALNNTQQFIEGNIIVNRSISVLYSREIVVFFVDRRAVRLTVAGMNVLRLPATVAGFERVNTVPINWDKSIVINGDNFNFSSAVCVETQEKLNADYSGDGDVGVHYAIGSYAVTRKKDTTIYYEYNPTKLFKNTTSGVFSGSADMAAASATITGTYSPRTGGVFTQQTETDIKDKLSKQGVIYIFQSAKTDFITPPSLIM